MYFCCVWTLTIENWFESYLDDLFILKKMRIKKMMKIVSWKSSSTYVFSTAHTTWTWTCFPWVFHFTTFDRFSTTCTSISFYHGFTSLFAIDHGCIIAWTKVTWWYVPWMKWKMNRIGNRFAFTSKQNRFVSVSRSQSQLTVDGMDFHWLQAPKQGRPEEKVSLSTVNMTSTYYSTMNTDFIYFS